jgi:hypothetical protein
MASPAQQLDSFKGETQASYSNEEWDTHMENIFEAIEDGSIDQDALSQPEYTGVYNWLHGR